MTSYAEALAWLYGLAPRGIRLELDRMQAALLRMGHPEEKSRFVHIAGTNGKGSVSSLVERALREQGYKTGLYTSPHLHQFTERIRIAGEPVRDAWVVEQVLRVQWMLAKPGAPELTFFEVATLLAFIAFAENNCDVVVLEVGLGGRLDATNVVLPMACAITSIGVDHVEYLGASIQEIAAEKAGILKPGVACVLGPIGGDALSVIQARAREVGATLIQSDRASTPFQSALAGDHQRDNDAVAFALLQALSVHGFSCSHEVIARAFASVKWAGRLETLLGAPSVLFDAAHNEAGIVTLAAHLHSLPRHDKRVLVFAAMNDKPVELMLGALRAHVDDVICTQPATKRAATRERYPVDVDFIADVTTAVDEAARRAGSAGLVIVAGSIYLLAGARAHWLDLPSDPPIGM